MSLEEFIRVPAVRPKLRSKIKKVLYKEFENNLKEQHKFLQEQDAFTVTEEFFFGVMYAAFCYGNYVGEEVE